MINPNFKHYNPQSIWGLYNKQQLASDCVKLELKREIDGKRLIKELTVFFEKENVKNEERISNAHFFLWLLGGAIHNFNLEIV